MKRILMLVSVLYFALACGTSRKAAAELNGNWELVIFPSGTKTLNEIFTMKLPEMQLENGRLSGSTGCNRINGEYTVSGKSIQFGPNLAMTKMGCPNYDENVFLEAFQKINRYELKGDQLHLMLDSTVVMTFSKK